MDKVTKNFTLEQTRSKNGTIVDAVGKTGTWPFRRTISYNAGVNCDSIAVVDGRLQVQRRGRCIAIAEPTGAPSLLQRLLRLRT
jgi:hypothetical protein